MTTISPNRKRTAGASANNLLLAPYVVVAGTVFIAREPFANLLWRVGVPLAHARDALMSGTGGFFGGFSSNQALVAENNRLREALASSSNAVLDRSLLLRENIELRGRLNRAPANFRTILGGVVLRPPQSPYDTVMIDAGHDAGM
jgi:hypothetical protein